MSRVIDNNRIESFSNPIFDSKYRVAAATATTAVVSQQQLNSNWWQPQQQQHFKKFYQQTSSRSNSTNRKYVLFSPPHGTYSRSTTAVSGFSSPLHYQKNFLKYKIGKKLPSASTSPFANTSDDNVSVVRRTLSLDTICDDDRKRRRPLVGPDDGTVQRKYEMIDKETQTDDCPVSVTPPVIGTGTIISDNKFAAVVADGSGSGSGDDTQSQFVQNSCRIGSMEALDEEIEKLVSSKHNTDGESAKLTRTVKTQTPSTLFASSSDDRNNGTGGSDFSPQINRFAAHGPPAGCEKVVYLKVVADEMTRRSLFQTGAGAGAATAPASLPPDPRHSEQLRPNAVFDLKKPSSCSAFCSLQQNRH